MLSLRAPLRTFNSSSRYAFSVKIVNILKPAEIRHVRAGGHKLGITKTPVNLPSVNPVENIAKS